MTESEILVRIISDTRRLTVWYLNKIQTSQIHSRMLVNGVTLHSPYWIVGHLAWAQQSSIRLLGGPSISPKILYDFKIFSNHDEKSSSELSFDALINLSKTTHKNTLDFVRNYPDTNWATTLENNPLPMLYSDHRSVINHLGRHEAYHMGQLGWFCKMNGISTV